MVLAYNICYANYGKANNMGLYIDEGTSGATLHHNVVIGDPEKPFAHGIFLNASDAGPAQHSISVYHNTVWNSGSVVHNVGNNNTVMMKNNHSGDSEFLAKVSTNNRFDVDASEFVDVDNLDNWDFRIADSNSPSIDAGIVIPGINDDFVGAAPDLGAYEFGGTDWTAGSDITLELG